nr:hypothetical protein [Candidatus Fonsibacter sp.]
FKGKERIQYIHVLCLRSWRIIRGKRFYLHGLPKKIAQKEQTDFAMILWLSDQIIKNQNINSSKIKNMANKKLNHDYLPHTLLNLFKVQSSVYKKEFSLVN